MRVVLQFLFCLRLWNSRVCNCLWAIPFSSWLHAKDQVLLAVGLARWSFRAAFHTHIAHGPLRNSKCSKTWNATLTLYKQSTISSKPEWRVKKLCKVCNVIQALCWLRKEENLHAKGWNKMKQSCLANSSEATSVFIQYLQVFEFTLGSCPISIISAFNCKSRMFCQSCWGWLSCLKCKHHPPGLIHLGPAFIPRPYAHLPNPCGLSRVSEGPTADARCFSFSFLRRLLKKNLFRMS